MEVFEFYKPIRNKISSLARDDALGVIWAYCQFLQIENFHFPPEIEVAKRFLELDVPQKWISEWDLEVLAKEVLLNCGPAASKGRTLRAWKDFSDTINAVKELDRLIYREFGSQQRVLVELIRISHRQFIWQANPPNSRTAIRYFKIFNRPIVDQICVERFNLSVWQIFMCGMACMSHFLKSPALAYPFKSDIKALPPEVFDRFFLVACSSLPNLKMKLKSEQRYDESFMYAYNSLRAFPLVRMFYQGADCIVCPLMTLLFWKFTGGLYYDLISHPDFANEFGDGFQSYVGEVLVATSSSKKIELVAEHEYQVGRSRKRTVDWIIADEGAAIFLECKARRLSLGSKISLNDDISLDRDIANMASSIVQVYKTLSDYLDSGYPKFNLRENKTIYPAVVTPENWRLFGPVMFTKLAEAVTAGLAAAGLPLNLKDQFPYLVFAVEELETALQVIDRIGIENFVAGKIKDPEMSQWDWHAYMTNQFADFFPLRAIFDGDYDRMFAALFDAQNQLR